MKLKCKKVLIVLLSLIMTAVAIPIGSAPVYASGNPVEIWTAEDLYNVRNDLEGSYILMNDIDLGGEDGPYGGSFDNGKGWDPIGKVITPFTGIFNGNGHNINGLYIDRPDEDYVGLFGCVLGVNIHNLGVENANVNGKNAVGGIVGYQFSSNMSNSYLTGDVSGIGYVGGLIGYNEGSSVSNAYFEGGVSCGDRYVGGITGAQRNGSIGGSYSTGTVSGEGYVGGLVGFLVSSNIKSVIRQSYSSSNVSDTGDKYTFTYIGGLVGYGSLSEIVESYFIGSVESTKQHSYAGGLVGRNSEGNSIIDSYSTGNVSGKEYVGGLAGGNEGSIAKSYATGLVSFSSLGGGLVGGKSSDGGTVTDSYWDFETSGGHDGSIGGDWYGTEDMQEESTFENWNFTEVWKIDENPSSYPYLKWATLPAIYSQTRSQAAAEGQSATFKVLASTPQGGPINYQWKKDGTNIDGATSAIFIISNVQASDAGSYRVEVSNQAGSVMSAPATLIYNSVSGGGDLIEIWTAEDLYNVRDDLEGSYILMADIDLSDTYGANYDEGGGWKPIRRGEHVFEGIFDGNGHTISGLYINRPDEYYIGLFAYFTEEAEVFNLKLIDVNVVGNESVGGLVGYSDGSISQVGVTGRVSGTDHAGGLVGTNDGDISSSYANVNVTSGYSGGGLAGVSAGNGVIEDTYALGEVRAGKKAGGLLGDNGGVLTRSYAAGRVILTAESTAGTSVGGLVGRMSSYYDTISDCYWDTETTFQSEAGVNVNPVAATGHITEQMKQRDTFADWNFDDLWLIDTNPASYPYFQWQGAGSQPVPPTITGQPQNQTVIIGQTATFTVTAEGSDLSYQWKKNGTDISSETEAILTIDNAQSEDAGSYTVEVSNTAGNIISDPATLTVNEAGSLTLNFTPGDSLVGLQWSEVPETVSYAVYQDTSHIQTVTGSVYSYEVTGLTNGQSYTFEVRAFDAEQVVIAESGQISATPRTVPDAPTNVTATAGNGRATVSFSAPVNNGGSPVISYTVTASPGNITASGTSSPITITGLTNGTGYTFTVKATNAAGNSVQSSLSNSVTPRVPSSSTGDSSGGSNTPGTSPSTGVKVIVNGKEERIATADTTKAGGSTIVTITVNAQQLEEKLQREGRNAVVTIPLESNADVAIGRLNGQIVKNMEGQEAVLEIATNNVSYILPAAQINIDSISSQFGQQVALKDILIDVKIAASNQDTAAVVKATADRNNYEIIAEPIEFAITGTKGNQTVEITKFNTYVECIIAIPEGIDPSKITTGIVLNSDGSFSHVPTEVFVKDGKWYAKLNSLTNSTYSVIWNPVEVGSVANHWSKEYVNDMASRLVIKNPDSFRPDGAITRGDFAEYITKALGVYRTGAAKTGKFSDVGITNSLADAITIASDYGIIAGYPDGTFKPGAQITREEAMIMYARAMDIVGLKERNIDRIDSYADKQEVSLWAYGYVKKTLSAGVFNGKTETTIDPKGTFTYAEAATAIRNLLTETELINK